MRGHNFVRERPNAPHCEWKNYCRSDSCSHTRVWLCQSGMAAVAVAGIGTSRLHLANVCSHVGAHCISLHGRAHPWILSFALSLNREAPLLLSFLSVHSDEMRCAAVIPCCEPYSLAMGFFKSHISHARRILGLLLSILLYLAFKASLVTTLDTQSPESSQVQDLGSSQ